MAGKSGELAAAAVLADGAHEMLLDAATALKDCGDVAGHDELISLSDDLSKAIVKIRARKAELDASQPANENG